MFEKRTTNTERQNGEICILQKLLVLLCYKRYTAHVVGKLESKVGKKPFSTKLSSHK